MAEYELRAARSEAPSQEMAMIAASRATLDQFYAEMREFQNAELGDILQALAGFSAYASETRGQIMRVDTRKLQSFRTRELDPFLEEVDRQFKIWSRSIAMRQQEWEISKGGM